jgi:Kef-type K+ transport system membrane component KefB
MSIAVLAPLLAEIPIGFRLPVVVLEMVLGIIVGPQVLGLARPDGLLGWFGGTLGLAALFFMAGMELDLERVRGRPILLAALGWVISIALGVCAAALLNILYFIHAPVMVAVALSTTAMGTLLPILRDSGDLETQFGRFVLAVGAVGEFGPVVAVSLLFTSEYSEWLQIGFILALVAITFLLALAALRLRPPKVLELFSRTLHSSAQLPVRVSILLIAVLFVLSETFGLDAVLGAFAAGMIMGLATRGEGGKPLRQKIDAVGFGFLMPFFFVTSGMKFDLGGLLESTKSLLLVPLFLILFLIVRGVPVFLYRSDITKRDLLPFALYSATALPMVVAITDIGVRTGRMQTDIAAGLVGAAMLSVLLFPAIAGALSSKRERNVS